MRADGIQRVRPADPVIAAAPGQRGTRAASALIGLLLAGAVAMPALAQQTIQVPAHPRELVFEPLDFSPPDPSRHRYELSNGTPVFIVEDDTLPLVTVEVLVRTGGYLDPPGKEGLASLTGSQIRSGGTLRLTPDQFDEEAAFLAVEIASGIGDTQGVASVDALSRDLDAALDLFFEMLRMPRFDPGRLELARRQALQAMERRNDSTAAIEGREWGRLMRGADHFSTRPETKASIEAITREDMIAFHRQYYHPRGFIFAVSGDVQAADILAKLETRMEGWESDPTSVPPVPPPDFTPLPGLYLVDKPDVNQGRASIGHLGATRENPDRYALLVMNDILGGAGFRSRLLGRIRSDEGLAYSVRSDFGLGVYYDGVFRVAFQSRSEAVARATAIVLHEIERIRTERVSAEELEDSIASFVETFSRNFSSAAATARLFASDEYTGRDPEYLEVFRDRIREVTADEVLRVAEEYLHPDRLVILVVGNLDDILNGDPEYAHYSLEELSPGPVRRLSLPDPFTMEYPQ